MRRNFCIVLLEIRMTFSPEQQRINQLITDKTIERAGNPNAIEYCVCCGKDVPEYKIGTHIDARMHFIEGCGQLCETCWNRCDDSN